jgi:putative acetyltransferase
VPTERNLIIRAEKPDDYPAIEAINLQAFGRPVEANLVHALRLSLPRADYSRVAVLDGKPVGHILFSPIFIDTDQGAVSALALAPMAVLPEVQGRGIGSMLVREGLATLRQLGERVVVVLGHSDFYPRFGFQTASRYGIQAPFEVPDPAFMVIELQPDALQGVQGTVRYPPAFEEV